MDMVEACAQQQMVDMVLIGFEWRTMLFDTCEADADSVEERYGEYAYGDRRCSTHMKSFGHVMIRIHFAEMEHEGREEVA